jgi:hypothetical protein
MKLPVVASSPGHSHVFNVTRIENVEVAWGRGYPVELQVSSSGSPTWQTGATDVGDNVTIPISKNH